MRKSALIITSAAVVASLAGGAAAYASTQAAAPVTRTAPAAATPDATASAGTDAELEAAIEAALAEVGPGTVIDADRDDDGAHAYEIDVRRDGGGEVEVKLSADLGIVSVDEDSPGDDGSSDDSDRVTDADARKKAADAALAEVGGGTVVSVELSDDAEHVYEVEIDLAGGEDADVELDADFVVVKVD